MEDPLEHELNGTRWEFVVMHLVRWPPHIRHRWLAQSVAGKLKLGARKETGGDEWLEEPRYLL